MRNDVTVSAQPKHHACHGANSVPQAAHKVGDPTLSLCFGREREGAGPRVVCRCEGSAGCSLQRRGCETWGCSPSPFPRRLDKDAHGHTISEVHTGPDFKKTTLQTVKKYVLNTQTTQQVDYSALQGRGRNGWQTGGGAVGHG